MYIRKGGSYDPHGRTRSDMFLKKIVLALSVVALASAQIPSLGWCPEYVPMANFDMNKFLGVWYEAERYFQLSEVASRCVMANYLKGPDGKFHVNNEVTNRITGIKRVLEGEIKQAASKAEEGRLHVKYTTVPLTPETRYTVLDTDYDNYAVMWSCSGIGPIHAQNAWLMTRDRSPSPAIVQQAYGVLDKYKISKTFFVKTNQEDCAYLASTPTSEAKPAKPAKQKPKPQEAEEEELQQDEPQEPIDEGETNVRSAVVPDAPEIIVQMIKQKEEDAIKAENLRKAAERDDVSVEVESVPEIILKLADSSKSEQMADPKEVSSESIKTRKTTEKIEKKETVEANTKETKKKTA